MSEYAVNQEKYAALARQAAAEGCVLLKNDKETLPIQAGEKIAVFGRAAFNYYKSGLGSGGLVNTRYVVSILDALKAEKDIALDDNVLAAYEGWLKDNPYDEGEGWGKVPWSQKEMPLDDALVEQAAKVNDKAIVIIGRTAGEDQDTFDKEGQYRLSQTEIDTIRKVKSCFDKTIVLLNVGNIIDMKWVDELKPDAVMYVWQGGQEGGNGVCDVLTGRVNPCGSLTDTIACNISDYPSDANFGDDEKNYYKEDIYVGYRYFETFARNKVIYPFGYGLSYTTFENKYNLEKPCTICGGDTNKLTVYVSVKNTGKYPGKETIQVYVKAPNGKLGKAERVLCAYAKTKTLKVGETQELALVILKKDIASFDDSGATGHKNAFVLEAGEYTVYAGEDVRSAEKIGSFEQDFVVVEQLEEAYAPGESFERMCRKEDGSLSMEAVPVRSFGPYDRVEKPAEIAYTGDKGYKLSDVYNNKISLDEFIAQLSKEDLVSLFRGEGMSSPKVTPGTGSAFGGLTESLRAFGIPAACTTDGPSGLRFDVGTKAFSLPNGTLLGCTFNDELVEELYSITSRELRRNRVDALLGPGINIHRHPLCGRNFEYISEDPFLTGKMGAAQIRGLNTVGTTGTIKHFCGNNQESRRYEVMGFISQRALREIYLKGFEMCVKEADARAVMTTYGPVNGLWTAGSYDLNTLILRKEWGFDGIVMSDWWAEANIEGHKSDKRCRGVMVAAGNDLYKCSSDAADQTQDDVMEELEAGRVTIGQLQRNARHILGFILKSPAMLYEMDAISQEELEEIKAVKDDDGEIEITAYMEIDEKGLASIDTSELEVSQGSAVAYGLVTDKFGDYDIEITAKSSLDELAQLPVTVYLDNKLVETIVFRGSQGKNVTETRKLGSIVRKTHIVKLYFGAAGLKPEKIEVKYKGNKDGK